MRKLSEKKGQVSGRQKTLIDITFPFFKIVRGHENKKPKESSIGEKGEKRNY